MKKYVFVHLLNDFSGSPKVLSQVIKTVQLQGGDIELLTGTSGPGFLSEITQKHYQYFYRRSKYRVQTLISFLFSQFFLFFRVLRYVNSDVVIYVNTMLPFGAGLAGYLIRKPVIYHVHEISITPIVLKRWLRFVIKLGAAKVIFVSNSVMNSEKFESKAQFLLYNALSSSFESKAFQYAISKTKKGFNVVMIASLKEYKGIEEFIEVAHILQFNDLISFTLVVNATQREISEYWSTKQKLKNVEILPRQSDVVQFYESASLLLNLSRVDSWVETFGLTILEAMAYGVPVIVPPVGGPAELVTDGVEGYLISSYKTEIIANKIQALFLDKREWLRLSQNALERSKDFTKAVFDKNLMNILNA